jgi:hypothetical protein
MTLQGFFGGLTIRAGAETGAMASSPEAMSRMVGFMVFSGGRFRL